MTAVLEGTGLQRGVQEPRLSHFPLWHTNLADDAVDLAMVAGIDLLPWEERTLRESLGQTEKGRWSAGQVGVIAPRQNGKNVIVEARELGGLFLLGERKILHTAHEFKTAKDAFRSLAARIEGVPDLQDLCRLPHRTSNEEVSINLRDGAYCRYIARNKNAGRGFREVDLIIADEAFELSNDTMGAFRPTQAAARDPQIWFTSSAGTGQSEVLGKIRAAGIAGTSKRLLFVEWSAPEGCDIEDRSMWPIANPSLGYFLEWEFLEDELQLLGATEFAREHLGLWDDPRIVAVIDPDVWNACGVPDSVITSQHVVCIQLAVDRSSAAIAVAGYTAEGLPQVEIAKSERGTTWTVRAAQALMQSSQPPKAIAVDGGGTSKSLVTELNRAEIEVLVLSTGDVVDAAANFKDKVEAATMRHRGDKALASALGAARKRPIGNAWAWGRWDASVDITVLEAATNAMQALTIANIPKEKTRTGKVW